MQNQNLPSDRDGGGHWQPMAIVVMVLVTTVVGILGADWRVIFAVAALLDALRRLVEVVTRRTT